MDDVILLIIPRTSYDEVPDRGYLGRDDEWVPGKNCPGCDYYDPANLVHPCCSLEALYRAEHP